MNKFGLHTFGLPSFGISDFRLTSFGGDGDGGRKAALPSPDLYYDLSLKNNEHPTRNIIDDMSGNGRHATIYNALYAEGSGYGEYAYEGAFVFDGIDDYARIENITKGFKTLFMDVVPFKTGGILFDQRMRDGVQVGGRNLVGLFSDIYSGVSASGGYGNYFIRDGYEFNSKTPYPAFAYKVIVPPSTTLTLSLDLEIDMVNPAARFQLISNDVGGGTSASSSRIQRSGKHSFTFTSNANGEVNRIGFRAWDNTGQTSIRVTNVKLEKGTKPTDWTPAPEDVFAISNLPNTIAYNKRNPNGVTYINGELNTNKYTDDMQNHRQVITIVNPTDTGHGSASIGVAYDKTHISSMALYKIIGFYDELTPAQIQKVITKYKLKYEQI